MELQLVPIRSQKRIYLAAILIGILAVLSLSGSGQAMGNDSPASAPLSATTVSYQVASFSDDVVQDGPTFSLSDLDLSLGNNGTVAHHVGVRFTGVNVPQGVVITEAHLQFTAWNDWSDPANMIIRGHDTGNSPTFSTSDGPMDRLSQANTPAVTWSPVNWAAYGNYTTPDLAPVLQQIIDRPDWSPGNSISLIVSGTGGLTGGMRQAYAYDRDVAKAARLYVTYEGANTANMINPGLFGVVGQTQAQTRPDLAVTWVTSNQAGYRAGSDYEITVEVTNVGLELADSVQVEATIERALQGTVYLAIGPIQGSSVVPITFPVAGILGPGETVILQSGIRPLDPDVLTELALLGGWVAGVPNNSEIFIRATVQPATDETYLENNAALSTFLFPTGPSDPNYDQNNDSDLDGWEDDDEPENCANNPMAYPGGIDYPSDGNDGDCSAGDNPSGWALTGNPAQGFANNPTPDSDGDGDGFTANQGDCWEGPNPPGDIAYPGAVDIPDGYDNDCDGLVDEDFSIDRNGGDLDGDGITVAEGDCDDLNGSTRPGASELPDGIDNNCNGFIDEGHLTPDWAITVFEVTPQDSECERFTRPELWAENTQCGLQFELEIENIGEDLGPFALEVVRNSAFVTDLVRDYGIPPSGSVIFPFTAWQPWPMIELMACGPIGFIAVIPAADGQGQLGESNLLNNQAIAYPPSFEQDIDIQFASDPGTRITYPREYFVAGGVEGLIFIQPSVDIEGSCPPPALIDFWTQVSVYQNDDLLFDHSALQVNSVAENPYGVNLDPRPANGDIIRIEILLNSDGMVTEEDTGNNLCVLEFEYDRAGFGSSRANDRLVSPNVQGCSADLITGGESSTVGSSEGALIGGSPGPGILLGGLLLGAIGGLMGWRYAASTGRTLPGILAGAGAGVVAGGTAGALGALLIVELMTPVAGISHGTEAFIPTGAELPEHRTVERIRSRWSETEPSTCVQMLDPNTQAVHDSDGGLADVLLNWNASIADLNAEDRVRITIWDASASPHEILPGASPVSLAQEGWLDRVGDALIWQLAVEEPVGGDLFLGRCTPSLQQFSLADYRHVQQIQSDLGDAPLFGGCDPVDPDCHLLARLEFHDGVPTLVLDISVHKAVVDQAQELDLVFLTDLTYSQGGDLVSGPLSQVDILAQLSPVGETIVVDGLRYIPFTIRSKVPAQLQGIVSVDGSLQLTVGERGVALGVLPIMAEALDLTPPPTPTPTSIPTPTPTPIPDTSGPKVGGVSDSPDPVFTNGNPPDTATVSASVSDPSGVASVTLYYRLGSKSAFQVWGAMSGSGGNYSNSFGPFGSIGAYEYRIYAVDNLGNANCSKNSVGACPGGMLTVTIP